jgi:hypothetical protein
VLEKLSHCSLLQASLLLYLTPRVGAPTCIVKVTEGEAVNASPSLITIETAWAFASFNGLSKITKKEHDSSNAKAILQIFLLFNILSICPKVS